MLPGKRYKPEDFLRIAWRHRWVIVVPLVLFSIGAFAWSYAQPNRYRSEAIVLIIPPQVPETLVRTMITESLQERLDLMRQQILSRSKLERIIQEFDLYPSERKTLLMDQIVELMRRDINVIPQKVARRQDPGHFTISFDSENPQTAMIVTERIASLFIRENLDSRGIQVDATSQFLQSQVDESLRRLQEHEARLESFRRSNAGRLPEEVQSNLQMMQSARLELQSLTDAINRDRDRQITIERNIADEIAIGPIAGGRTAKGETVQTAAQELATANAALATMQLRLKDDHPDVRIAKSRIVELERKAEAEALQQPLSDGRPSTPLTATDAERVRRLSTLRAELESLERGIKIKRAKAETAQTTIASYQRRVETAPMLESQLSGLMRDYGTLKVTYEGLLRKMQDAKVSANLEQRQAGEQFRIIDPARRPEHPHSPNRVRMNIIGALMGLGLGLAIAGLLEYRDTSVRTEEDVLVALSLPVLALVPTMSNPDEQRGRRRWLLIGSSAAAMIVVSLAAVAWKLRLFESWIG